MEVTPTEPTNGAVPNGEVIDEGLYSRQLYVLGKDAMQRMAKSNVLIIGLGGLGVEIAKNLILMGVKSVTIHDDESVAIKDLSSQFYLTDKDVGMKRSEASVRRLMELNRYVPVSVHSGPISAPVIKQFQVVCMTTGPLAEMLRINDMCRATGASFVAAETRGVFGYVFDDFGTSFTVYDTDGEEPISCMIASITQEKDGVVTALDESRHGFQDGDYVSFTEVLGMEELNRSKPLPIKVLGPYTFSIGDTTGFSQYVRGGIATQVKMPKTVSFLSLRESLAKPEFLLWDFANMDRSSQLHLSFQALDRFRTLHNGLLPTPASLSDAAELITLVKDLNTRATAEAKVETVDETLVKQVSFGAAGDIAPLAAFIGGVAAQEVLKATSGKFSPLKQWFYFDAVDALPEYELTPADCAPTGSRYDGQVAVFGRQFQQALFDLKYFLVGAGAIGCEMLKNWAMMGVGASPKGRVHITDMDSIEKSNLSRQFLFREWDIQKMKSTTASAAALAMNPSMNIQANIIRVAPETEDVYDDEFWDVLDGVCNALDNVQARLYVDRRCVYFRKSLLESGTLGAKGNTQVVVPFLTENYGASHDPPEKSIPICTLKNFPHAIEHTLQWARDLFEGLFKQGPEDANQYLQDPSYLQWLEKQAPASKVQALDNVKSYLVTGRPQTLDDCIVWARLKFEDLYDNTIRQLLYSLPVDLLTSSGVPFWSGPKRPPTVIQFNAEDPLHIDFVMAGAILHAVNYGIPIRQDREYYKQVAAGVMVPEFTPQKNVRIATTDAEAGNNPPSGAIGAEYDDDVVKRLLTDIPAPASYAGFKLSPIEFEKDDDANFHMEFIAAASNLRARNYKIPEADRLKSKGIAGKIIPAIATTTAVVAGLVCLELYKLVLKKGLTKYRNGFVNLALPFFGFSDPVEAPKQKMLDSKWTLWDRFDIDEGRDLTMAEFLEYFKSKHRLEISMISCGLTLIYSSFGKAAKERLPMKLKDIVVTLSKTEPRPKQNHFVFEVCCNDEEGEDVDVPYVRYRFRFD
eukprot:CAMPEP_0184672430 /NCGR_PEP_ID=MMETSP0308-20130426/86094_1 /TAXON_ID=38269 /ORGANISM="Gloeochaete witrockiana, Strain SAG 46.84" /LENGTH=1027 /DNA_ID=CAMNT_0027119757 /DNA_START=423 /DNA_END=3506 /DNA_ORIENTATION=+